MPQLVAVRRERQMMDDLIGQRGSGAARRRSCCRTDTRRSRSACSRRPSRRWRSACRPARSRPRRSCRSRPRRPAVDRCGAACPPAATRCAPSCLRCRSRCVLHSRSMPRRYMTAVCMLVSMRSTGSWIGQTLTASASAGVTLPSSEPLKQPASRSRCCSDQTSSSFSVARSLAAADCAAKPSARNTDDGECSKAHSYSRKAAVNLHQNRSPRKSASAWPPDGSGPDRDRLKRRPHWSGIMAIKYGRPIEVRLDPAAPTGARRPARPRPPARAVTARPTGRGAWCARMSSPPTT